MDEKRRFSLMEINWPKAKKAPSFDPTRLIFPFPKHILVDDSTTYDMKTAPAWKPLHPPPSPESLRHVVFPVMPSLQQLLEAKHERLWLFKSSETTAVDHTINCKGALPQVTVSDVVALQGRGYWKLSVVHP
jgi:hypothetical protein